MTFIAVEGQKGLQADQVIGGEVMGEQATGEQGTGE